MEGVDSDPDISGHEEGESRSPSTCSLSSKYDNKLYSKAGQEKSGGDVIEGAVKSEEHRFRRSPDHRDVENKREDATSQLTPNSDSMGMKCTSTNYLDFL